MNFRKRDRHGAILLHISEPPQFINLSFQNSVGLNERPRKRRTSIGNKASTTLISKAEFQASPAKRKRDDVAQQSSEAAPQKKARVASAAMREMELCMETLLEDLQNNPSTRSLPICDFLQIQLQHLSRLKGIPPQDVEDDSAFNKSYIPEASDQPSIDPVIATKIQEGCARLEMLRLEVARHPDITKLVEEDLDTSLGPPSPQIMYYSTPFYYCSQLHSFASELSLPALDKRRTDQDFKKARHAAECLALEFNDDKWWDKPNALQTERLRNVLETFLSADDAHVWSTEALDSEEGRYIIVYRQNGNQHPLLIVTIRAEDDFEAEQALSDITKAYLESTQKYGKGATNVKAGAPTFFLAITREVLLIGGALHDPVDDLPLVQRLPGSVDIGWHHGYIGEISCTLWALMQGLGAVERELKATTSIISSPHAPLAGLGGGGIIFTEMLRPGTLYKVKLNFALPAGQSLLDGQIISTMAALKGRGLSEDSLYVVKATYPFQGDGQDYGTDAHQSLAKRGLAPALYLQLSPIFDPLIYKLSSADINSQPSTCYAIYSFIEELPPYSAQRPGWLSLLDYARRAPHSAVLHKESIWTSLNEIIHRMTNLRIVHGDLRPKNIMICVKAQGDQLHPHPGKKLDIRLIDFRWSGNVNEVFYPTTRDPSVKFWPGEDGESIGQDHDKLMVESWMRTWPSA